MATEVLMSFSNAGLGSIFATWLRRRIMKEKGLYDTRSVYLDNIALREQAGTALTPDRRFQEAHDGITLIGAKNPNWNSEFLKAMSECRSMVIVATKEWGASSWCWQEFDQANLHASKPERTFKRVALIFPDTKPETRARLSAGGWESVPVKKVVVGGTDMTGDFAEVKALKGGWVISEKDLEKVLVKI